MRLRRWQEECLNQALRHYTKHQHFLCLATPGAGKSILAAELARQMHVRQQIDLVLCFSPSITIAEELRNAMEERLGRRMDGALGAAGGSYTYQNLLFFKTEFWSMLEHHRVLVIFDEIHHCSGSAPNNANAWGEEILLRIQNKAAFTLALTGTPWRSDMAPIVLSHYQRPEGHIHVNYRYGLRDAIRDEVCRLPRITLIENERVSVTESNTEVRTFTSLSELFTAETTAYTHLIHQDRAIRYMLTSACNRLAQIRGSNPDAAGLVIAASVIHAEQIAKILQSDGKQVEVVSYQHPDSIANIKRFRQGAKEWIVSVGMISEGTDIPRLQVCCHLSPIKTELHYRQVLGRILRKTKANNNEAWLYTFAEPSLVEYAKRIANDLPEMGVITWESSPHQTITLPNHAADYDGQIGLGDASRIAIKQVKIGCTQMEIQLATAGYGACENQYSWGIFREAVIATFDSPFLY